MSFERYVQDEKDVLVCGYCRGPWRTCGCFHYKKENILAKHKWIEYMAELNYCPFVYKCCGHTREPWLPCKCPQHCTITPEEEIAHKDCTCEICQEFRERWTQRKFKPHLFQHCPYSQEPRSTCTCETCQPACR